MKRLIFTLIIAICGFSLNAAGAVFPDKYSQFLSCFSDSTYYAVETISGQEVLLVSNEVFLDEGKPEATRQVSLSRSMLMRHLIR